MERHRRRTPSTMSAPRCDDSGGCRVNDVGGGNGTATSNGTRCINGTPPPAAAQRRRRRGRRRRRDGDVSDATVASRIVVVMMACAAACVVVAVASWRASSSPLSSSSLAHNEQKPNGDNRHRALPQGRNAATAVAAAATKATAVHDGSIGDGRRAVAATADLPLLKNEAVAAAPFRLETPGAPPCSAPLTAEAVTYTLVTQLSPDRLWMVPHHCDRWGDAGPISIAMLTDRTADDLLDELTTTPAPSASGGLLPCRRDRLTVTTIDPSRYDDNDYPVNALRNAALSRVKTTHVVYVDVDFWEGDDLGLILSSVSVRTEFASDARLAAVLPAFQIVRRCREYRDCRSKNVPAMPRTVDELLDAARQRVATMFDPTNPGGHGSTLYGEWLHQDRGSFLDVTCVKSNRYEPYLAFRYCRELPPFQEAFTGYGKNKMTWSMQLRRSGYRFAQLGGAYVVHYPHLDSVSRMEWNKSPPRLRGGAKPPAYASVVLERKKAGEDDVQREVSHGEERTKEEEEVVDYVAYKRGRNDALFVDFRSWLRQNVPDVSRVGVCDDAQDDDARLWIPRDKE